MKIAGHKDILFVKILLLLFTFLLANTATAQDPVPGTKLTAALSPAQENALFGQAVAISDTVMVVGAPSVDVMGMTNAGLAYVFTHDGTFWDQGKELNATSLAPYAYFGQSVATKGNLVVVGAPEANSAYVFTHDGTGWVGEALPSPPAPIYFGWSVATDGMRIVVGDPVAGSAHVFTNPGTGWVMEGDSLADPVAWFGSSVSISGDTLVVGAPCDLPYSPSQTFDSPGSAYVFAYDQDTSAWEQTPQATLALPVAGFGTSVSISGDRLVVSAPTDDVDESEQPMAISRAGAVYLFKREVNANQTKWVEIEEQPKVNACNGVEADTEMDGRFGWSVYIDGDTLAVGSPFKDAKDTARSGAAYVYTLKSSNQPPVANAGDDQEVVEGDPQVTLDGSLSNDPDGDKLTFAWEQTGDGPNVELADANTANPTFSAPPVKDGCIELTFELTVTDGKLTSEPAEVQVKVLPNNKIHAKLGGKHRHWWYWHKYTFDGSAGDEISINLEADPDGWHRGEKATLILKDKTRGVRLLETKKGSLPLDISTTLEADGKYAVYVFKHPWFWSWWRHNSFEGDYILTLEGTCGKLGTSIGCKKK